MAIKKESAFDIQKQHSNIESKIIVGLSKISEVFRVLLWSEAQELKMSPIQLQILIFVKYHSIDQNKVGYLAKEFNVTKATISDSVKVLIKKDLLIKVSDPKDSRSFSLSLTEQGLKLTSNVEHYTKDLKIPLLDLSEAKKKIVLESIMELIFKLQRNGIIEVQRMCYNCSFYKGDRESNHYCNLLDKELNKQELRMDCPEFNQLNKQT